MSFESDMIAKYKALFGDRLFWDEAPEDWTANDRIAPFGILQQVGGIDRQYVNDKEEPEFLSARIQLFVWGARRLDVSAKLREFVSAVRASNSADWYARPSGEAVGDSNEVLKIRGSRQDFMFNYRNPQYQG